MRRKLKLKSALDRYLTMQGPEPVAVLHALLNRALEAGDLVAAERLATTLAPYTAPRLTAVSAQLDLWGETENGEPVKRLFDERGRQVQAPITYAWGDEPAPEARGGRGGYVEDARIIETGPAPETE